jgi:hypothetical protein
MFLRTKLYSLHQVQILTLVISMVLSLNINQLFEFLLSLLQLIGDFDGVPLDFVLQVLVLLEKRLFYPFLLHRL